MTAGKPGAQSPVVTLADVDSTTLQHFLQHMYGQESEVPVSKLVALYSVAQQYDVQSLTGECLDAVSIVCYGSKDGRAEDAETVRELQLGPAGPAIALQPWHPVPATDIAIMFRSAS